MLKNIKILWKKPFNWSLTRKEPEDQNKNGTSSPDFKVPPRQMDREDEFHGVKLSQITVFFGYLSSVQNSRRKEDVFHSGRQFGSNPFMRESCLFLRSKTQKYRRLRLS